MFAAKISSKSLQPFKSNAYFSVQMSILMLTRSDVSLRIKKKNRDKKRKKNRDAKRRWQVRCYFLVLASRGNPNKRVDRHFLFSRVHATLQPTLSVCRSVGRSVGPSVTLCFFSSFYVILGYFTSF